MNRKQCNNVTPNTLDVKVVQRYLQEVRQQLPLLLGSLAIPTTYFEQLVMNAAVKFAALPPKEATTAIQKDFMRALFEFEDVSANLYRELQYLEGPRRMATWRSYVEDILWNILEENSFEFSRKPLDRWLGRRILPEAERRVKRVLESNAATETGPGNLDLARIRLMRHVW